MCVRVCAVYVYMIVLWGCDDVANYRNENQCAELRQILKKETRGNWVQQK